MILRREDVARSPAHLGAQRLQRLDEHRGLDGHVQRAGDAGAASGWVFGEFLADRHQARHLALGDVDFLAAPIGERDVGDDVISARTGLHNSIHKYLSIWFQLESAVGIDRRCSEPRVHRRCSAPRRIQLWKLSHAVFDAPASAASAAALSVFSQVNSGSLRPKWP